LTVDDVLLRYWQYAEVDYKGSPKELERIRLAIRPLRRLYGTSSAANFGAKALKAVRRQLLGVQSRRYLSRSQSDAPAREWVKEYWLSRRTINQRIDIIRRVFRWAAEEELVPAAIYHQLQTVASLKERQRLAGKKTSGVQPVPDEDVDAILPLLSSPLRALIEIQRLTGARSSEVLAMRPRDIDQSGVVWEYRPTQHKNAHRVGHPTRVIILGPKAQAILRPFLNRPLDAYMFSPREATLERYLRLRQGRKSKLVPSQVCRRKDNPKRTPGDRYTTHSYRKAVQAACRKAGVTPWHPHQLRHSAATRLRKTFGLEVARTVLGHASIGTTEIYAQADRDKAAEVMASVG
jgi:integrase